MEETLNAIIAKVQKMFKYSFDLKGFLVKEPYARVKRLNSGKYQIMSVYFDDRLTGNVLFIQPNGISLYERVKDDKSKPEQNPYRVIVKYKDYDELLGME